MAEKEIKWLARPKKASTHKMAETICVKWLSKN
jgi:hypothetical protein